MNMKSLLSRKVFRGAFYGLTQQYKRNVSHFDNISTRALIAGSDKFNIIHTHSYTDHLTYSADSVETMSYVMDNIYEDLQTDNERAVQHYLYHTQMSLASLLSNNMGKLNVSNHNDLWCQLEQIIRNKGEIAMFCGGVNSGKSMFLEELTREYERIFYINLRQDRDIVKLLLHNAKDVVLRLLMESMDLDQNSTQLSDIYEKLRQRSFTNCTNPLTLLIEYLFKSFGTITFIIDHIDVMFTGTAHNVDGSQQLLHAVAKKQINLVAVTNNSLLPFDLQEKLQLNVGKFSQFIYCSDISPSNMFELYTQRCDIGRNFALSLIDLFGGNIISAFDFVRNINDKTPMNSNVSLAIFKLAKETKHPHIARLLKNMAHMGHSLINSPIEQEAAEIICRHGLGMMFWKQVESLDYMLIPIKQSDRLILQRIYLDHP